MSKLNEPGLELHADVLVVGGGPAAAWAALAAAERGARVVIADKGYLGTSGAFAASTSGAKVVPPVKGLRDAVKFERYALGGHLAVHSWWDRILDITFEKMPKLYEWGGYEVPAFTGKPGYRGLQGSETMRIMRRQVKRAGVEILDHSPALELLVDEEGAVAGARGYQRQERRSWTVTAGAVILASGGCAWLSKALGCNTNTGDGLLMAVEAGAELSGMEFSSHYAPAPKGGSVTKNAFYRYASFADKDLKPLEGLTKNGHRSTSAIAKELMKGPVLVRFDQGTSDPDYQKMLRMMQPNFMGFFERSNIDPFKEWFEIELVLEGTVRGVGGVRIDGPNCEATVKGLYAAGDAATRELNCGGFTGGAGPNMTWAIGSGNIAGAGAADYALSLGREKTAKRAVRAVGKAGLVATKADAPAWDAARIVKGTQDEFLPFDRNIFRSEQTLLESLGKLERLWQEAQGAPDQSTPQKLVRSREAVGILAAARWAYFAGLERKETRGIHKRTDFPKLDPAQRHYLAVGGLDKLWTRPVPVAEEVIPEPAKEEAGVHA